MFKDKVAIVTGGASGIGRGLGEELARRGAKVALADIDGPSAENAAAAIRAAGGDARAVRLDVTDQPAVQALVEATAAEHGRLDYLFNNAGVATFAEARDCCHTDWRRVIDVDFLGVLNGVSAAYPLMVRQGFGHIVNTASLAGLMPFAHLTSYTAAKYGVVGMSHALRMEGAALGVKVSVVCPGLIRTNMYHSPAIKIDQKKLLEADPPAMSPERCARIILRGVEKNRATIVVTVFAKLMATLYRFAPGSMLWLFTKMLAKSRKMLRVE